MSSLFSSDAGLSHIASSSIDMIQINEFSAPIDAVDANTTSVADGSGPNTYQRNASSAADSNAMVHQLPRTINRMMNTSTYNSTMSNSYSTNRSNIAGCVPTLSTFGHDTL
jgi:hypothetical protein